MLSRRVRMLTRVRPAGAPVYHHVKTCIPVRGVRTSPRAWFKPRTDGEGRFFKAIMDVGPRQATIETDVPAITSKGQVLEAIREHFRMSLRHWVKFSHRPARFFNFGQAIVILVTPSFAKWLEDDVLFIPRILQLITHPWKDPWALHVGKKSRGAKPVQGPTGPPFEIDVVCACVDGLAPNPSGIRLGQGRYSREGISLLHGRTGQIISGVWEDEPTTTEDSPSMQSSLTFSKSPIPDLREAKETRQTPSNVTLPLANTLFTNGRHSTLLVSRWQAMPDGQFKKIRSKEKRNQVINVFHSHLEGVPSTYVPAVPLTPIRRIVSGLGNIIRQLHFADDGPGPASRELEPTLDEYMKAMKLPISNIGVWALIIPLEALPDSPPKPPFDILTNKEDVQRFWQERIINPRFIGYWLDKGATFCRVVSGGGGWGAKQGLLSLDPQTTYRTISEARFDYTGGSIEEHQASALGDIAKPNSFIQFFAMEDNNASPVRLTDPQPRRSPMDDRYRLHTVLGTVPSTVDQTPQRPRKRPKSPKYETFRARWWRRRRLGLKTGSPNWKDNVIFRSGHFGAVSESGLYLDFAKKYSKKDATVSEQDIVETKINFPYSYVYRDHRLGEGDKLREKFVPLGASMKQIGRRLERSKRRGFKS